MTITAILPVFNEEKTVANVLSVLSKSEQFNEIIVIDDASTDNSLNIAKGFQSDKLKIIHLEKNLGKSGAVKFVVKDLQTDILFFCDGDLHNFTNQHIDQLLKPLKAGKHLMTVGIRDRGIIHNTFVKKFGPLVTGERAMPYGIFKKTMDSQFNNRLMEGYNMEIVLNNYCKIHNIPIIRMISKGVKETFKPCKCKNGTTLFIKEVLGFILVFIKLKTLCLNRIKKDH
ncbi:glycosyltransferase family 2 protein [Candidatus Parcubacteria bacterium]|nr:glycosyltransferase family 2 protein [Candidatus Parcubacteria bacterium]